MSFDPKLGDQASLTVFSRPKKSRGAARWVAKFDWRLSNFVSVAVHANGEA